MQKRIEIKNMQADVLFSHDCEDNTIRKTLEKAISEGVNLEGADLRGANLRGADLRDAYLGGAKLMRADLRGANLRGASLSRSYLLNAIMPHLDVPIIPDIHKAIYQAVSKDGSLNMDSWHTCETTHCRAGWAIHLAGDAGKELEKKVGSDVAGALIYMASDPSLERVPDWFASNEDSMDDIKKMAGVA